MSLKAQFSFFCPSRFVVAVSGGADSMALALLAKDWAKKHKAKLIALTVDHRLRPESAKEAKRVAGWMKKHGIPHHILTLPKAPEKKNLQARARELRYEAMTGWCRKHKIDHLLLGHHQDDQAETFLLRLQRGSGVDGLSCMAHESEMNGITLLRPLLAVPKEELIGYLKRKKQKWIEDPSNQSNDYERNRIRKAREAIGVSSERLADTAARMRRAREALEHYTIHLLRNCSLLHAEGYATLHPSSLYHDPADIGLRALAMLLSTLSGEEYKPRLDDLARLYEALGKPGFRGATLNGVQFIPQKADTTLMLRERRAVQKPQSLKPGEKILWDSRFLIEFVSPAKAGKAHNVGMVGERGISQLRNYLKEKKIKLPRPVLLTLPALWHLEKPLAVPHIGYYATPLAEGSFTARFHTTNPLARAAFSDILEKSDSKP